MSARTTKDILIDYRRQLADTKSFEDMRGFQAEFVGFIEDHFPKREKLASKVAGFAWAEVVHSTSGTSYERLIKEPFERVIEMLLAEFTK